MLEVNVSELSLNLIVRKIFLILTESSEAIIENINKFDYIKHLKNLMAIKNVKRQLTKFKKMFTTSTITSN